MGVFFSLGALAPLLLAGCGGGMPSVRFKDFEAGSPVVGMPMEGADLATLKQQAAAWPSYVFVDHVGERITGGPEVYHATILRTDAPLHDDGRRRDVPVTLEWLFAGDRLVAVGWRGATEDINGTRDKTARSSYKPSSRKGRGRVARTSSSSLRTRTSASEPACAWLTWTSSSAGSGNAWKVYGTGTEVAVDVGVTVNGNVLCVR